MNGPIHLFFFLDIPKHCSVSPWLFQSNGNYDKKGQQVWLLLDGALSANVFEQAEKVGLTKRFFLCCHVMGVVLPNTIIIL